MIRKTFFVSVLLLAALSSSASAAVGRGTSMFAIQLTSGTADLYNPFDAGTTGYISAYDHSEIGIEGQYWNMMADDYAFCIAAGIGFFGETNEPGPAAAPGDPQIEYSQSSFHVRFGGDRVVNLGRSAVLYFGPGIEYWSGKAEFEGFGGPAIETENVGRISLSSRLGAIMTIGESWGITGSVGHKIGTASAEDQGAEAKWWPSSFDAAGGVVFMFGGE